MTNKQIAMNAIGKVQGGCAIPWQFVTEGFWQDIKDNEIDLELMGFFFSHEFLKAFFGENWQRNAKEMVLTLNPLQYLRLFI